MCEGIHHGIIYSDKILGLTRIKSRDAVCLNNYTSAQSALFVKWGNKGLFPLKIVTQQFEEISYDH